MQVIFCVTRVGVLGPVSNMNKVREMEEGGVIFIFV